MPAHNAVSSTPMAGSTGKRPAHEDSLGLDSTASSWAASMESPLERIDRDLRSLQDDPSFATEPSLAAMHVPPNVEHQHTRTEQAPDQPLPQQRYNVFDKGKGKPSQPSLLQNVLSKNLRTNDTASSKSHISQTGPLKVKSKTPKRNPYVPPETRPKDWDGIVDLSKPLTPKRHASGDGFSSDEDDRFLHGMSPPITMDFARPNKGMSAVAARIGRTPVKEAAMRIGKDLVGDAERHRHAFVPGGLFAAHTSQSTAPSISSPSLSRYTKKALGMQSKSTSIDTSLESLLRHVATGKGKGATNSQERPQAPPPPPPAPAPVPRPASAPRFLPDEPERDLNDQDDSFDSLDAEDAEYASQQRQNLASPASTDSSFSDSPRVAGQPSSAFLMASANQRRTSDASDSSFGSNSDSFDADDDDDAAAHAPVHPFARRAVVDDGYDDSFDDDSFDVGGGGGGEDEPTVFGVRESGSGGRLRLHGEEVFDTRDGLTAHMQREGVVPVTPTPGVGR